MTHARILFAWLVGAAVILAARPALAQHESWYVHPPFSYDALVRQIASWAPTDDAGAWRVIDVAYRAYFDEAERLRGDELRRMVDQWPSIERPGDDLKVRERYLADRHRLLDRSAVAEMRMLDAVAAALPESVRLDFAPVRRMAEMRHLLNGVATNEPSAPAAIEAVAGERFEGEAAPIVRDACRAAIEAVIVPLRRLDDASRDWHRESERLAAEWMACVPFGTTPDAAAVAGWQEVTAARLAPLCRPLGDSIAAVQKAGLDPLLDGATKIPPADARRLLRVIVRSDRWLRSIEATGDYFLRRLEGLLQRPGLSDDARRSILALVEEMRSDQVTKLPSIVREMQRGAARETESLLQIVRGEPNRVLEDFNRTWRAFGERQQALWKDRMSAVRAATDVAANEPWPQPDDRVASIAEVAETADGDGRWTMTFVGSERDPWEVEWPGDAELVALVGTLALGDEAEATLARLRAAHAAAVPAKREAVWPGSGHAIAEDALDVTVDARCAILRAELEARETYVAAVKAAIARDDRAAAIDAWIGQWSLTPVERSARRRSQELGDGQPLIDRSANPFVAVRDAELSDANRAAAIDALASIGEPLRRADARLAVADLDASIRLDHSERTMWSQEDPLEARVAGLQRHEARRVALAETLRPLRDERASLQRRAVDAVRAVLPPDAFETYRRTLRRTAFPSIDRERQRFERPALAALDLKSLDDERRTGVLDALVRWSDEFELRTERLAAIGCEGVFLWRSKSPSIVHGGMLARWTEFRRRQEGFMFLHQIARMLTADERRRIGGLRVVGGT